MKCPNCNGSGRIADARGLKFAKPVSRRSEKSRKKKQGTAELREIRATVMRRADGGCEACHIGAKLEMDHWLGGAGRRREKQSAATCWALCAGPLGCHRMRTENRPNAAWWNERFREHCTRHGFEFSPHIEKPALPQGSA